MEYSSDESEEAELDVSNCFSYKYFVPIRHRDGLALIPQGDPADHVV